MGLHKIKIYSTYILIRKNAFRIFNNVINLLKTSTSQVLGSEVFLNKQDMIIRIITKLQGREPIRPVWLVQPPGTKTANGLIQSNPAMPGSGGGIISVGIRKYKETNNLNH